jgi:hypothetical protein
MYPQSILLQIHVQIPMLMLAVQVPIERLTAVFGLVCALHSGNVALIAASAAVLAAVELAMEHRHNNPFPSPESPRKSLRN